MSLLANELQLLVDNAIRSAYDYGRLKELVKDAEAVAKKLNETAYVWKEALTTADVAAYMGCERTTVTKYIRSGMLTANKVGKEYFIDRNDLLAFLLGHPMVPAASPPREAPCPTLSMN